MKHLKIRIYPIVIFMLAGSFVSAQAPDTLWTKTYGTSRDEVGYAVQQTTDGGYIIAGDQVPPNPPPFRFVFDVKLIKTDSLGDTIWTKTYGDYDQRRVYGVQQTFDGGYIVVGSWAPVGEDEDVYLLKIESDGDTTWTKTYGGNDLDWGSSVLQTADSGYIIVGYTESYGAGNVDIYCVRTDSDGDTLWTKTYGGPIANMDLRLDRLMTAGILL